MDSPFIAELISRAAAAEGKIKKSKYGYTPTTYVAFIFLALFGISTILHLGQAIRYRMWWLLPTACLCGVGELAGWGGRLWSSYSPTEKMPFMIQITTTIIAPTPLIAVSFILLGRLVDRLGPCYSRISPQWYSRIFVSCDFIALVVQGAGGGMAASADDEDGANMGAQIMLGGIIFQAIAIMVYVACAVLFLRAYSADKPVRHTAHMGPRRPMEPNVRLMIWALTFSTAVLFIRSIYRTLELATGWHGKIIETELWFNLFDGAMVVLAIYTINVAHPGRLLAPPHAAPNSYALPDAAGRFRPDSPSFPSSVSFVYPAADPADLPHTRLLENVPLGMSQQTLVGGDPRIVEKSAV